MAMKNKAMSWFGDIVLKLESVCQEVDGIVKQETSKHVEPLLRDVGKSVTQIYSKVARDSSSSVSNHTKSAIGKLAQEGGTAHASNISVDKLVDAGNKLMFRQSQDDPHAAGAENNCLNQASTELCGKSISLNVERADSFMGSGQMNISGVVDTEKNQQGQVLDGPSLIPPVAVATHAGEEVKGAGALTDEALINHDEDVVSDEDDLKGVASETLSSVNASSKNGWPEDLSLIFYDNDDRAMAELCPEISVSSAKELLPLIKGGDDDSSLDKNEPVMCVSTAGASSEMTSPVISLEKGTEEMGVGSLSNPLASELLQKPESLPKRSFGKNLKDDVVKSNLDNSCVLLTPLSSKNDNNWDDLSEAHMETINLNDDVRKDEENYFSADSRELLALSYGVRKSFKKKIQDIFAPKRRIVKEYEQLGIAYGDIDWGATKQTHQTALPYLAPRLLHAKSSERHHASDCEWELL